MLLLVFMQLKWKRVSQARDLTKPVLKLAISIYPGFFAYSSEFSNTFCLYQHAIVNKQQNNCLICCIACISVLRNIE